MSRHDYFSILSSGPNYLCYHRWLEQNYVGLAELACRSRRPARRPGVSYPFRVNPAVSLKAGLSNHAGRTSTIF
jgi:hypothetical protein